ncbi:MAG: hypothetical protein V3V35_10875 [Dehalococcoidia bacterium]
MKRTDPASGPRSRRWLAAMLFGLAAAVAAACGGSSTPSGGQFPETITLGEGELFPVITNSALAVGENRFSLGLLDEDDSPILGADVHLRFFDLTGEEQVLKSEADARFIPVELFFIDETSGKEKRLVGSNGVYVAQVSFDTAGDWGVQVAVTLDGSELDPAPFRFNVLDDTPELAIGDPTPASRQLTLADVADVTEIDSSFPSRPQMHEDTVADALATGKPLLVAFATPAFCESRTCGPVMDTVMDPLREKYGDEAVFIHIEPFRLKELREGTARIPVETTEEWGLQTEPWLFVINREGKVAAKFEGIMALDEVEEALVQALEEA